MLLLRGLVGLVLFLGAVSMFGKEESGSLLLKGACIVTQVLLSVRVRLERHATCMAHLLCTCTSSLPGAAGRRSGSAQEG